MAILTVLYTLPLLAVCYVTVLSIYRLNFHPLRDFPGPKLAAATKWYEFYFDIIKRPGGTFMYEINRMHEKYGPIVRINPHELHIKDSSWVDILYTGPSQGIRDKYAPAAHMTGSHDGIFGTLSHDIHRRRRAAIGTFFSKSSVNSAEDVINEKSRRLLESLYKQNTLHGYAELRRNYLAMTTDALCEHTFNWSTNLLDDEERTFRWFETIRALASLTPLVKQFIWIIPLALKLPSSLLDFLMPTVARIVAFRRQMMEKAKASIIRHDHGLSAEKNAKQSEKNAPTTLFEKILSSRLPPEDKTIDRLAQEGFSVIAAGGETTAQVLVMATFHILENKERVLGRLKLELTSCIPEGSVNLSLQTLENLPWLTAIIKESLRIAALLTSRLPLIDPTETLSYGKWTIPLNTPISMSLRDTLHDPDIFENPLQFRPDRWLENGLKLQQMNRAFLAFGRGSRMCIGVNFAMAELYIVLAHLFRFHEPELFETTRTRDIDVVRDFFIGEPSPTTKGVRITFPSTQNQYQVDCENQIKT